MLKRTQKLQYYVGVSILQMGTLLFILIVSGFYQPFYKPPETPATIIRDPVPEDIHIVSGTPQRLRIPSLDMDRDLLDGVYNPSDASWTLSSRGVHYALASAPANDYGGSTFIYGHNNRHVFGPLTKLSDGDVAEIVTTNDLIFSYRFTKRDTVKPEDTSILTYQDSPRLTLQTCSGNWHQNRELYYFELVSINSVYEKHSEITLRPLAEEIEGIRNREPNSILEIVNRQSRES